MSGVSDGNVCKNFIERALGFSGSIDVVAKFVEGIVFFLFVGDTGKVVVKMWLAARPAFVPLVRELSSSVTRVTFDI